MAKVRRSRGEKRMRVKGKEEVKGSRGAMYTLTQIASAVYIHILVMG